MLRRYEENLAVPEGRYMAAPDGGTLPEPRRYSVPEVARLLSISERAVRKRIDAGTLKAERDGNRWIVLLHPEPARGTDAVPDTVPGGTEGGTGSEPGAVPLEARYRVTPAELEQALERTQARYVADLRSMFDEVSRVYADRLADKDAMITAQAETITELRRRAEQAEAEAQRLRERNQPQALEPGPELVPQPRRPWWKVWR